MLAAPTRVRVVCCRGFLLRELLMVVVCLSALTSITVVCFGRPAQDPGQDQQQEMTEEQQARMRDRLRDANTLRQMFQAMMIFSQDARGSFPLPGLINRLPVEIDGVRRELPGRGEEDISRNTTANLFSVLIAQNYFTPELCISPLERNPKVKVDDDYNYDAYQPADDSYWDATFTADLEKGSNVSYAHLVLFGERVKRHWRDALAANVPLMGNRGPKDGRGDPKSFTCDAAGAWSGNVVYADGHANWLEAMASEELMYTGTDPETGEKTRLPDNLFVMENGAEGGDVILSFTKSISELGVELQHD